MSGSIAPALNAMTWGTPQRAEKVFDMNKRSWPDDSARVYQENLNFADFIESQERDANPTNVGRFSRGVRERAEQIETERKSKAGKSLLTGSNKPRKRIYGMGKTTGQKSSGTVKKPKLGGE
jgi:hypothetical protein